MKRKAYLTIDDGPSEKFEALVDFLGSRNIPAVFFNRGDRMAENPNPVVHAVQRGYQVANHGYNHKRASKFDLENIQDEILKTEEVIRSIYMQAGVKRTGKYFRFPYMDRGMGACFVEPENLKKEHKEAQEYLLKKGLGNEPETPGICHIEKKRSLQTFLKAEEFDPLPTPGVTLPWYAESEMGQAIDSLCTFSTSDWAVSERHKGKHGFSSLDDLKAQIDNDPWLQEENSAHIILVHDQAEIHAVTCALIEHFCSIGFQFQTFESQA